MKRTCTAARKQQASRSASLSRALLAPCSIPCSLPLQIELMYADKGSERWLTIYQNDLRKVGKIVGDLVFTADSAATEIAVTAELAPIPED